MNVIKTFKEFTKDYCEYYQVKKAEIGREDEFQEVCYELYYTDDFEIDYDNKIVNLFNVPAKIMPYDEIIKTYEDNFLRSYDPTTDCNYSNFEEIVDKVIGDSDYSFNHNEQIVMIY